MSDHFTSSDEDVEEIAELMEVPKNSNYFEETVPQYDNAQYMEHFRISRQKTADLAERFKNSEYFNYQEGGAPKISALKFITTFLWFAGHESVGFRDVADRFNMTKKVIVWPTANEKVVIERHFRENNFPGVIGAIDGTHIRIDKPTEDADSYLNRKHYHSIQAQMVCDHRKMIRDIFVGFPGSVHDSRVLRNSPLYNTLPEKCQDYFILGDSGYPCLPHLLTPFRDTGQLSRRQRNYNYLLSKNRYLAEHSFGIMKHRFRQLYHLKLRCIRDIVHFIRAYAVLHNIAIEDDFEIQGDLDIDPEPIARRDMVEGENEDDVNGIQQRNNVMNILPFMLV
ncbi:hypothetical protein NQ314_018158 [Rhamnusium bicolor]|uniref:DDE Tnp4 domain-containing protein n=1 Tax=Rhamnusium bicolor TaxID=1586634 RepID=A0AAV8WSF5_9CUCU|nr:hypothetical protein NQ314_018158 [Rhamnusium bicolor]